MLLHWTGNFAAEVIVFKEQCIDESQLHVALLKINVDPVGLMNGSDKFTKCERVQVERKEFQDIF